MDGRTGDGPVVGDVWTRVLTSPTTRRYWRFYYTGSGFFSDLRIYTWGITGEALIEGDTQWIPAPLTIDDDDATYHFVEVGNTECWRGQLLDNYQLGTARLVIGCETAGARTYDLEGQTLDDIVADTGTVVGTFTFTATGSYTADTVLLNVAGASGYQFYRLVGPDENRRLYTVNLFSPVNISADEVEAIIDEHIADPTDAHDASAVSLLDTAGLFAAANVEAALAEGGLKTWGYQAHGNTGTTETFSAATAWHSATLNDNCTFTLTANPSGTVSSLFLELLQDGTGGRTITLPSSVTNKTELEADQDTTLDTTSLLVLLSRDGGTTWYGGWWGGSGGSDLTIEDEGTPLATAATTLDFVGAGVTASGTGVTKTITIPGASGIDLDDLGDVTITAPAEDDDLRYNGSVWVNDPRKWEVVTDGEDVFVWEDDDLVYEWSSDMVQHGDIDHSGITGVGGSLTVENEGTPLTTAATTLDFVGAGVTASGTGAEKTITIAGGFDPDTMLPWIILIIPMVQDPDATTGTWAITAFTATFNTPWVGPNGGTSVSADALFNSSSAQNDAIAWDVILAAGTWDRHIHVRKSTNTGIVTLQQAGADMGTAYTYAAAAAYVKVSITGWTVASTGKKRMNFKMATKNASSSGYIGGVLGHQLSTHRVDAWHPPVADGGGVIPAADTSLEALYNGTDGVVDPYQIGAATFDGSTWTVYGSNPVIAPGGGGTWDDAHVKDPALDWDGSQYVVWYAGHNGTEWAIGRATASSITGTWTKDATNPVFEKDAGPAFDDSGVLFPVVLHEPSDTGKEYKLWYGGDPGGGGATTVGYAYSSGRHRVDPSRPGHRGRGGRDVERHGYVAGWHLQGRRDVLPVRQRSAGHDEPTLAGRVVDVHRSRGHVHRGQREPNPPRPLQRLGHVAATHRQHDQRHRWRDGDQHGGVERQ